jgi:hypothetical protein
MQTSFQPLLLGREGGGGKIRWIGGKLKKLLSQLLPRIRPLIQNLLNSLTTPRQKPRKGGGHKQINSCRKVPFQVTFKTKRFCIAFFGQIYGSKLNCHFFHSGETSLLTLEASLTMPVADVEFEISETSFGKVTLCPLFRTLSTLENHM